MAEDEPGSKFNMAMMYYLNIQNIMQQKTLALVNCEYAMAISLVEELLTKVSFKLQPEEVNNLDKKLKTAKILLRRLENSSSTTTKTKIIFKMCESLRSSEREILRYMDKHKMIFPEIVINGGIEQYRKKMGL